MKSSQASCVYAPGTRASPIHASGACRGAIQTKEDLACPPARSCHIGLGSRGSGPFTPNWGHSQVLRLKTMCARNPHGTSSLARVVSVLTSRGRQADGGNEPYRELGSHVVDEHRRHRLIVWFALPHPLLAKILRQPEPIAMAQIFDHSARRGSVRNAESVLDTT